jgi:hypothetical protein
VIDNDYLITGQKPYYNNGFYATKRTGWQWRLTDNKNDPGDIFADQFIGWVYDKWEIDAEGRMTELGRLRSDFMDKYMTQWITEKIVRGGR